MILHNKNQTYKYIFHCALFLLLLINTQSYLCKQYVYDTNLLVLDWPAQFCNHHKSCKPNWKDLSPQNQWIIHGLWPSSTDLDFLNCIQYLGHDPSCYVGYTYNDSSLSVSTKAELNTYWPQIIVSNDIKQDQWEEHGTCYLSVVQTMNTSMIGNEGKVFESYYKDTMAKAKNIKLDTPVQQYKYKYQLATSLGIKQDQFFALCQYDGDYVSQIRICYSITGNPGQQSIVSCKSQQPNQCEFPVKLRKLNEFYSQFMLVLVLILMALIF